MTVKKKGTAKKGKAVAATATKSKALMTADALDARFAAEAEQESSRLPASGGSKLSIRGGEFTYKGASLGETMDVVILGYRFENAWYGGLPYDSENPSIPACFAIGDERSGLKPHEDAPEPQTEEDCSVCEYSQWGSADNGRAKACKDTRRLVLMHASDLDADAGDIELVMLSVPPKSTKNFDKYAKGVFKMIKRPLHGVVTQLAFDEDSEHELLTFNHARKIEVSEIDAVDEKMEEATEMLDQPYDATGYITIEDRRPAKKTASRRAPPKKAAPKKAMPEKKSGAKSRFSR